MARRAEKFEIDPVIVPIDDETPPTMTFEDWLALVAADEPVDLGSSAAELLAETRRADGV